MSAQRERFEKTKQLKYQLQFSIFLPKSVQLKPNEHPDKIYIELKARELLVAIISQPNFNTPGQLAQQIQVARSQITDHQVVSNKKIRQLVNLEKTRRKKKTVSP